MRAEPPDRPIVMPPAYYEGHGVTLYKGDCRVLLPAFASTADVIITDPPYGETSIAWDRWPFGWPGLAAQALRPGASLWCFGSMRMYLKHHADFGGWKFAQDLVWDKNEGTGFQADRFRRIHEHVVQWYRGRWGDVFKDPQREPGGAKAGTVERRGASRAVHLGGIGAITKIADGTRLVRSILRHRNMRGRASHPTEKPVGLLAPLVGYSCRPGGVVLDLFAGSGSTLEAAWRAGRRAIGFEADEGYCERIATRMTALGDP